MMPLLGREETTRGGCYAWRGQARGEDGGGRRVRWLRGGFPATGWRLGSSTVNDPGATKWARPWTREFLTERGKKGAEKRGYYGMAKGGSLGKLRDLSHPPIAVQSLHSSIISVFVESYSHSHRRRFSSGSENHARSRLRHPLSAPESRTLPVTRKYRPQRCPFRFRVPAAVGIIFLKNPSSGG